VEIQKIGRNWDPARKPFSLQKRIPESIISSFARVVSERGQITKKPGAVIILEKSLFSTVHVTQTLDFSRYMR
jgi:hypothetical protein